MRIYFLLLAALIYCAHPVKAMAEEDGEQAVACEEGEHCHHEGDADLQGPEEETCNGDDCADKDSDGEDN